MFISMSVASDNSLSSTRRDRQPIPTVLATARFMGSLCRNSMAMSMPFKCAEKVSLNMLRAPEPRSRSTQGVVTRSFIDASAFTASGWSGLAKTTSSSSSQGVQKIVGSVTGDSINPKSNSPAASRSVMPGELSLVIRISTLGSCF